VLLLARIFLLIGSLGILADSVMSVMMIKDPYSMDWPLPSPPYVIMLAVALLIMVWKTDACSRG